MKSYLKTSNIIILFFICKYFLNLIFTYDVLIPFIFCIYIIIKNN